MLHIYLIYNISIINNSMNIALLLLRTPHTPPLKNNLPVLSPRSFLFTRVQYYIHPASQ